MKSLSYKPAVKPAVHADYVLRELVRSYDEDAHVRAHGLEESILFDILVDMGVFARRWGKSDFEEALNQLQQAEYIQDPKAYIETLSDKESLRPTPQGLQRGRWLLRTEHWYWRFWGWLKRDVRTVVIGALSGVGAAVLATLIMKLLGWID